MDVFANALTCSFFIAMITVLSNTLHGRFTNDLDMSSIQKFHAHPVPRIGGLSLLLGLFIVYLFFDDADPASHGDLGRLLLAGLPIFAVGAMEDVTKKVSAKLRLYVSFISAALVCLMLDVHFTRVGWPWLDHIFFAFSAASFIMTLLVIAGTIHAMNLIDGFNGLMLGVSILMFAAVAMVSIAVHDAYVLHLSLLCLGAIGGLFLLNFPLGKLFAGDSGAYFVGFLLGTIVLMLVQRNPQVSAWFPCLLIAYPIFETLFSIYRKVILRKMAAMQPDGVHLHMLVYKRMLKNKLSRSDCFNNSLTSPYLWVLSLLGIIPAAIFWRSTLLTIIFCLLFAAVYVKIYWNLVLFKNQINVFKYVPWYYDKKLTKETI